jgi:hydroxymethylbilane synthase
MGADVELVRVQTRGDVTSGPIQATGTRGWFTKEIQLALLDRRIDLAVHSLKDLPTEQVAGLALVAVPPRESPGDVLVSPMAGSIEELPHGARVGTGSRRRQSQLLHLRSDLRVSDIRGNVDTRLRKLDEGQYDAIILAEAGLRRLGWEGRIAQVIPPTVMLPAVGQGALGIETRADDAETQGVLQPLNDPGTYSAVLAERAMLHELRGGCLAPVGAWGRVSDDRLQLDGVVLSSDGDRRVAASVSGPSQEAPTIGIQLARQLLAQGAEELISQARG